MDIHASMGASTAKTLFSTPEGKGDCHAEKLEEQLEFLIEYLQSGSSAFARICRNGRCAPGTCCYMLDMPPTCVIWFSEIGWPMSHEF